MIHVRLYDTNDLQGKRGTFTMTCPDCKGQAKVENPLWTAFKKSGLSFQEFNEVTGAGLESHPIKYISCSTCEHGFVNCWFYLSDLDRITKHQVNRLTDYIAEEIKKVNEACQTSISDLQVELSAELSNETLDIRNEIQSFKESFTGHLAETNRSLISIIDSQRTRIDNLSEQIKDLRQEINQDNVLERVFGDKGES